MERARMHLGDDVDAVYAKHMPNAEGARVFYMEVGEARDGWLQLEAGDTISGVLMDPTREPMAMMVALVRLADNWLKGTLGVDARKLAMDDPVMTKHKMPFLLAVDLRFAARVMIYLEVASRLANEGLGAVGSGTGQPAPS